MQEMCGKIERKTEQDTICNLIVQFSVSRFFSNEIVFLLNFLPFSVNVKSALLKILRSNLTYEAGTFLFPTSLKILVIKLLGIYYWLLNYIKSHNYTNFRIFCYYISINISDTFWDFFTKLVKRIKIRNTNDHNCLSWQSLHSDWY